MRESHIRVPDSVREAVSTGLEVAQTYAQRLRDKFTPQQRAMLKFTGSSITGMSSFMAIFLSGNQTVDFISAVVLAGSVLKAKEGLDDFDRVIEAQIKQRKRVESYNTWLRNKPRLNWDEVIWYNLSVQSLNRDRRRALSSRD